MSTDPATTATAAEVVLVVTLGKSSGASTVAAGLAVANVAAGQRVVLAELDPAGGDLTERIVFDGWPASRHDATVPPGARQLADHLETTELSATVSAGHNSTENNDGGGGGIRRFLVAIGNVPGLAVLLGDPLVEGAGHAARVVGPHLGRLAGQARFDTVVVDGGRWTTADPDRLAGVDLVYAVVEASSASQNHRCVAEAQSLWRLLRARNPSARMVVVVARPYWPARQLLELYQHPPGVEQPGYRVVVLELDRHGRHGRHAAVRLAAGRWAGIDPRGLAPFIELARPIGATKRPPRLQGQRGGEVDEHAYLDSAPPQPLAQRPAARPTWPFGDTPPGDTPPGGTPAGGSAAEVWPPDGEVAADEWAGSQQ